MSSRLYHVVTPLPGPCGRQLPVVSLPASQVGFSLQAPATLSAGPTRTTNGFQAGWRPESGRLLRYMLEKSQLVRKGLTEEIQALTVLLARTRWTQGNTPGEWKKGDPSYEVAQKWPDCAPVFCGGQQWETAGPDGCPAGRQLSQVWQAWPAISLWLTGECEKAELSINKEPAPKT